MDFNHCYLVLLLWACCGAGAHVRAHRGWSFQCCQETKKEKGDPRFSVVSSRASLNDPTFFPQCTTSPESYTTLGRWPSFLTHGPLSLIKHWTRLYRIPPEWEQPVVLLVFISKWREVESWVFTEKAIDEPWARVSAQPHRTRFQILASSYRDPFLLPKAAYFLFHHREKNFVYIRTGRLDPLVFSPLACSPLRPQTLWLH